MKTFQCTFIRVRVQQTCSTMRRFQSEQARQFRLVCLYKQMLRRDEEREENEEEEASVSVDAATMAT